MSTEQIAGLVIFNIFIVPGIFFSVILCSGNGADLIAGYNTASHAERAKWDEKALCRGVGVLLLVMLACMELLGLGAILGKTFLLWIGGTLFALFTVTGLIYINKSKRFKRK